MDNLKSHPQKHHLPPLREALLLVWNLPIKLGWVVNESQGSPASASLVLSQLWDLKGMPLCTALSCGVLRQNAHPHTCEACSFTEFTISAAPRADSPKVAFSF